MQVTVLATKRPVTQARNLAGAAGSGLASVVVEVWDSGGEAEAGDEG